jgi:hypothetical protein
MRGEAEEDVLQKAAGHAKEHGIREVTPELIERVKANIRDASLEFLSVASVRGAVSKSKCFPSCS